MGVFFIYFEAIHFVIEVEGENFIPRSCKICYREYDFQSFYSPCHSNSIPPTPKLFHLFFSTPLQWLLLFGSFGHQTVNCNSHFYYEFLSRTNFYFLLWIMVVFCWENIIFYYKWVLPDEMKTIFSTIFCFLPFSFPPILDANLRVFFKADKVFCEF